MSEGWAPVWIEAGAGDEAVDWCWVAGSELDPGDFRRTVDRCLLRPFPLLVRRRTPLQALLGRDGPPVAGVVAHLSRCGSTLLARMLATLPGSVVLCEAPPVDHVLRLPAGVQERAELLRGLVAALAAPWAEGAERVFLKLDAWSTRELATVRLAFPDAPWVFLYRDPLEVAVSQLRLRGAHLVPGLLPPELFGLDGVPLESLTQEAHVARVLASIEAAGLAALELGGGRLVRYDELPAAVPSLVMDHLGIPLDGAGRERLLVAAAASAKNPTLPFEPDGAAKQSAATPPLREAVDRYARPGYEALEERRAAAC